MILKLPYPLSHIESVDSIPATTKSRTWQEMKEDNYEDHEKDIQQHYFTLINQSRQQIGNIDIQQDPRPRQMKRRQLQKKKNSSFSETKGRRSHLCLNSLNLFFETS